jgi:hypothetical protein
LIGILPYRGRAGVEYQPFADKYVESRDFSNEGKVRGNLAIRLRKLSRLDEARHEICRKIESDAQFGHAAERWKTWAALADIETDAGNLAAAADLDYGMATEILFLIETLEKPR